MGTAFSQGMRTKFSLSARKQNQIHQKMQTPFFFPLFLSGFHRKESFIRAAPCWEKKEENKMGNKQVEDCKKAVMGLYVVSLIS